MIGIVVVCHGRLAQEFVDALEHIVGPQQNVAAICIGADDDMDLRRRDILDSVAKVDNGTGVAVLTDMFGGTPSNLALSVMDQATVEASPDIVADITRTTLPPYGPSSDLEFDAVDGAGAASR